MTDKIGLLLKGAAFALVGQVSSKLLTYLYRIIIAREGPEVYGLFSLGLAVLGMASTVALVGFISGVQRFVAFYMGKNDKAKVKGVITTALKVTTITSVSSLLLIFYFSEEISTHFSHDADLAILLSLMVLALPFLVYKEVIISAFLGFKNITYVVLSRDILDSLTKVVLTALLIYMGYGLVGIAFAFIASSILVFLFLLFILETKIFPIFRTSIESKYIYREMFTYSIPLFLGAYVSMIAKWADTMMIGYFKTPYEVGIYNAAQPTALLLMMIPGALLSLFLPVVTSEYARGDMDSIRAMYINITKWIVLSGIPILSVMIIFASPILAITFSPEYAEGGTSLIVLSLGYFVFTIFWPASHIINMVKKTKISFYISLFATGSNILLNWLLIPLYGIMGAAVATSSTDMIIGFASGYFAWRYIKIVPFDRKMFLALGVSGAILSLSYIAIGTLEIRMWLKVLGVVIMNAVYLLALFRSNLIGDEEKDLARKALKKIGLLRK